MNVRQAVEAAKQSLANIFADEQIANVGLEEVEFDDAAKVWHVTLGFSRPWDRSGFAARAGLVEPRSYKVVTLSDSDGRMISIKNRQPVAAE